MANQYQSDPRQQKVVLSGIKDKKHVLREPKYYDVSRKGWIYAIKIGDFLKIGSTNNLDKRLETYLSRPPFELELLLAEHVEDKIFFEKYFHQMFKEYQVKGEWFYIGDVDRYKDYVLDSYKELMREFNAKMKEHEPTK